MEVQDLLRFLTQEARIPLATALAATPALKTSNLDTLESLSKSKPTALASIFPDDKVAKQVIAAAKRVNKKRAAGEPECAPKRVKRDVFQGPNDTPPSELEASLDITPAAVPETELQEQVYVTNRAPLVLAFAFVLTKYTLPYLPPSSRWSLAQAVVSEGARKKAQSIGLAGQGADEEGWGAGQPVLRVMGREVRVLKRWGYSWNAEPGREDVKTESETDVKKDPDGETKAEIDEEPAVWGIDLEKLKKLNGPLTFSAHGNDTADLPVYSPSAARAYLLRSFSSSAIETEELKGKKPTLKAAAQERERNVARLLQALDMLYSSWSDRISRSELDRRAWGWYVAVRPDVEAGTAGWGAKGQVKLADILDLRHT